MARKYEDDVYSRGTNQDTILNVLNKGILADAYTSKINEQGVKEYKSSSISVPWSKVGIQDQRTFNVRIQNSETESVRPARSIWSRHLVLRSPYQSIPATV